MASDYNKIIAFAIFGILLFAECINRKNATYRYFFSTDYCAVAHPFKKGQRNRLFKKTNIIDISASSHFVASKDSFVTGNISQEFYLVSGGDTIQLTDKQVQDSCSFRFSYMKDKVIEYIVFGQKNGHELNEINRFFDSIADSLSE